MAQQYGVDIVAKVVGDGKVERLNRQLKGTAASSVKASAGLNKASVSARRLGTSAGTATGGLDKLSASLAKAAAAYFALSKAAEIAGNAIRESVARETAERQLSILAKQFGETDQALLLASRSAKKFGLGLTETTKQITQIYARLRPLGASVSEIETVFNGFNTAARLGGSTAAEASGAFLQLSQALGSGYLRGQEFNSVAEQAPMVLQAIAKETGLAVGQLKEFAAEGGITSDIVLRALKRIETEGAGQLAEALETPQQAFKDLKNATEEFNVALGQLIQPAVIQFVRTLTSVLTQLTDEFNKTKKAAEFLAKQLEIFAPLGDAVKSAFDKMGIGFTEFVNTILRSLPVIGSAIQMLEKLGQLRDFLAQQQDNSRGGRNFGEDYKAQEKALFEAAGGFSPYSSSKGLSAANQQASDIGGGSLGGSGGTARQSQVPQLQQELALQQRLFQLDQQIAEQKRLQNEKIVQALEIEKLMEQSALRQWEIKQQNIPQQEQELQRKIEMLNLESQIAEIKNQELQQEVDRQARFEEIISDLEHQVALSNETNDAARDLLEIEREIAKLRKEGVITTSEQADAYRTAASKAKAAGRKGKSGGLGKEILGTLKSGLGNVISTAIKGGDVKAALQDLLGQLADKLINHALDQLFAPLEAALSGSAQKVVEGGADMAQAGSDVVAGAAEQVSAAAEGAASAALEQTAAGQMTGAATQQVSAATQMITAAAQQMAAAQIMASSGGFGFFADGGRPTVGEYSVVGENGPELVKFDQPGTVFSNEESKSMVKAMDKYSPANAGTDETAQEDSSSSNQRTGDTFNWTFETRSFGNEEFVSREQLEQAMQMTRRQAVNEGAAKGSAMTFNKLKNSRSQRKKVGM